jgi:glycosyltransferase involved in cell wall biosynthesis
VFHRPQQTFSAGDVELAVALGDRLVLSQLDLIAYRNPGYFADAGAWEDYRRASRHGLVAAERVVVFSEHTRVELTSDALLDPTRIHVVPPGLDHRGAVEQRRPPGIDELRAEGFVLCLGTDFRHKNRVFALRLLEALRKDHGWGGSLVLAGTHLQRGSSGELEAEYLRAHPEAAEHVIDLGAVSEEEKAWLLAHTLAVFYPSVYEGFGLVPFESALAGVPCVFAAQSSLAEVAPAGTAAIVPWDVAGSAARAHELLTDREARARNVQELARAASRLTWSDCAASMIEAYREAASAPAREGATLARDASERERSLTEAHARTVALLIDERERVLADYDALLAEVGPARALVGRAAASPRTFSGCCWR